MKFSVLVPVLFLIITGCQFIPGSGSQKFKTFCNPADLSYRFCLDQPSRREAADPTLIWFRDRYFLFASKSGGYWHSKDLTEWELIETSQIPVEEYAPTAIVINDAVYFLGSSTEKSTIYKSFDPLSGEWSVALEELEIPVWDPAFFQDEDDRLYLYWGCSDVTPIYGVEIDYNNNFAFIGETKELIHANPGEYGWEVPGDYNTLVNQAPWIEGAWMTKRDGMYYLQYSGPGTEFKSYADGVYVSDNPLGPFNLQEHNPFVYKPEGFAAGAGHGSMFADIHGNMWHIGTISISQKQIFERRLGLYPAFFDDDGTLFSITKYGDYPLIMPDRKVNSFNEIFPGWMLLSYDKRVVVSSSVDTLPAHYMTDEEIRTYWAAETGNPGEYAMLDFGALSDVHAIQVNFAEHNTEIFGRNENLYHRYTISHSDDGATWNILIDRSRNETDNSHVYIQLDEKVQCRYIRVNNIEVPGGHFAISGFRVFGKGSGSKPGQIGEFTAARNQVDRRSVDLTWEKSENATGYNISYGSDKNKLYHNYMVYRDTTLTINSLNVNQTYYFSIESFNENGITMSDKIITVK
jgi:xylan 1,4-beta-xylosidase